ncbi:hypothetical protein Syun_023702 [Stephania yunnanensis]|uniref:Uncharacterized protein n=1 Tax=Stephania yunnanensis TaxID=152371 RepID=A0AAP0F9H2_9MAGN
MERTFGALYKNTCMRYIVLTHLRKAHTFGYPSQTTKVDLSELNLGLLCNNLEKQSLFLLDALIKFEILRAGIDLLSLNVMEGKICWDLYIEGLVINANGNLYIEGLQIDLIALCQLQLLLGDQFQCFQHLRSYEYVLLASLDT